MRFLVLTLFLLLTVGGRLFAQQKQDVIIKRDGSRIEGMVSTISPTEIFYGTADMPTNVFKTVPVSEVAAILYRDGKMQSFEAAGAPAVAAPSVPAATTANAAPADAQLQAAGLHPQPKTSSELYRMGNQDAEEHYSRYSAAKTSTLIATSMITPVFGLIPAIIISSTPPARHNLGIPQSPYSNDPNYLEGYKKTAKKIKSRKTWAGYGIGAGISVGLSLLLRS